MAEGIGALAALIGAVIMVYHWGDNQVVPGLIVGAVLVIGGLMLRIEQAIRNSADE
ncbi:hypothetical protein [Allorhizocola rhizosphaerae]|uniref:hypothetical protein n=1 Tax=Allorhizocola rhizosphaerae TaxID=1872709 RepID=UPI0013C36551|nr:hypothetical protein [Allorhizocola rhizosphaerae]